MRTQLALLLTLVLAAAMASNALATTPRDDAETPDTSPAEVGIATPAEAPSARVSRLAAAAACSSGAHTLSRFGDRVYPEMGNGGYKSVHSDVFICLRHGHEHVPAGHARRPTPTRRRSA